MIELEDHIALLHEYNDIKDVAQMLLGKLGEYEGVGRWLLPSQGPLTCWPLPSCQLPCSCNTPTLLVTSLRSLGPSKAAVQFLLLSPESQAQGLLRSKSEQDLTTCETRLRSLISTAWRDLEIP